MAEGMVAFGAGVRVRLMNGGIAADACIGGNATVNTGTAVEDDRRIGARVHAASRPNPCGRMRIGTGPLAGAGDVVFPGVNVGASATAAVGAAVVPDAADGVTSLGTPTR